MKTLTILLLFISMNCLAQNRFDKQFTKADNAFTHRNDSTKYWQMISSMEDTTKITLTVNQCLQLYMHGYLNGAYDYRQKGEYDIDAMWEGMIKQHKALRFQIRFFKLSWKDNIRNPENAEFIDEVSFNEGIPFNKVTQKQFNKRYEIK